MIDRSAFRFFHENAGGIVGQSAITAASLARAERHAWLNGWECSWEWENGIPYEDALGDHEYWCKDAKQGRDHEHEILAAILRDSDGTVLASLGAIIDPDRNYMRVVEAELASEALAEIETSIAFDVETLLGMVA